MKIFAVATLLSLSFAAATSWATQDSLAGPIDAKVLRVIDGDTILVRARIWLGQEVETNVRLLGVDTPELKGKCEGERDAARRAQEWLRETLTDASIRLHSVSQDKWGGRVLARVETEKGQDLTALLVAKGYARTYDGGKRAGWC